MKGKPGGRTWRQEEEPCVSLASGAGTFRSSFPTRSLNIFSLMFERCVIANGENCGFGEPHWASAWLRWRRYQRLYIASVGGATTATCSRMVPVLRWSLRGLFA